METIKRRRERERERERDEDAWTKDAMMTSTKLLGKGTWKSRLIMHISER